MIILLDQPSRRSGFLASAATPDPVGSGGSSRCECSAIGGNMRSNAVFTLADFSTEKLVAAFSYEPVLVDKNLCLSSCSADV